jgi:ribonuclease D
VSVDNYQLVEDPESLRKVIGHLQEFDLLAIDFEGEWNLHRYGLHLCLIQVSDGDKNFLIDPLKVGDLDDFLKIMEDPRVEIISHGPQSDIVLMDYLFGRQPRNLFDTEKAAQLLGYENTSLSFLLERHFGVTKNTKVRVSDWNQRPLTEQMLNYASKDVEYLHRLREILVMELTDKGRREWLVEECMELEEIRFKQKENPHLEIQGSGRLTDRQAMVLKAIYEIRDQIARELDKPAYYIIPNAKLVELAVNPPRKEVEWSEMKGINPKVNRYSASLQQAVEQAMKAEVARDTTRSPNPRMNGMRKSEFIKLVDQKTALLEQIRERIKQEYDIYPMILSMRNLKRVANGEATLDNLKAWQRVILLEKAGQMQLDLSILNS